MKTHPVGVLLLTLLTSAGAHTASFDCAKARTPVEQAICKDAALGALDEAIAREYRSVMAKLDPRYGAKLQAVQQTWLKSRTQPGSLADSMRERLADLRNAFVTVNGVALLRTKGKHAPPYVLTLLPGAAAYNREVDGIVDGMRDDDGAAAEIVACDKLAEGGDVDAQPPAVHKKLEACTSLSTTWRVYVVDFVSPDLLSIEEQLSENPWRAAHPMNSNSHMNRWLSKPGKIVPRDIFKGAAYRAVLDEATRRFMRRADMDVEAAPRTEPAPTDTDRWRLSADALTITGQTEDYGMGNGYAEIAVPWRDFKGAVDPAFVALLKKAGSITDPRLK